eukprot:gnl/TRDRNA2_/TRDRNA2_131734_c0_seq2.p1 gnl/TRDRNA2_/TRDRNA2_131734_c0~~gnl/TRDRNA2_/TRDRNA2_131734_c0_seq2.p1  ORF type:complete len:153 (+),score=37.98 gnl/TRDRNA2_/TRDRNA2_131734_c0_seq2:59-517(+)
MKLSACTILLVAAAVAERPLTALRKSEPAKKAALITRSGKHLTEGFFLACPKEEFNRYKTIVCSKALQECHTDWCNDWTAKWKKKFAACTSCGCDCDYPDDKEGGPLKEGGPMEDEWSEAPEGPGGPLDDEFSEMEPGGKDPFGEIKDVPKK